MIGYLNSGEVIMYTLVVIWSALLVVVVALFIARSALLAREDDTVHLADGEQKFLPQQQVWAAKLNQVEIWGKSLTVVLVIYGLGLLARFIYMGWVASAQAQH